MRPRAPNTPSLAWLVVLAAILALFGAHAGRYWDFTVDDAGITFAYARNLAAGHGLVLTPGAERVEAATNFLWCLLLTPAGPLGMGHDLLAKLLGLAGGAAALACIAFFPSAAYRRAPRYFDLVAPAIAAVMPHFALWSISGLETGLFAALATASLLLLAHEEHDPRATPWSAVTLALLFATRPDGALYAACIGAAKVLRQLTPRPRRQDLLWLGLLAGGVGALELFRLAYFAWPFPNSFYTKQRTFDFGKDLFSETNPGLSYVGRWIEEYKLTRVVYLLPAVLLDARAATARLALLACVGAGLFFPIYSHGDWMEEFRFLSFVAPIFTLALGEAVRATLRFGQLFLPGRVRAIFVWSLTPIVAYALVKETTKHFPDRWVRVAHHETLEMRVVQERARYFVAASRRLSIDHLPGLLDPDVGGSSYDGRLAIVDLFGLGDISIAHAHPQDPPGTRDAIFWERRPTFVHLHGAWFAAMELTRLEELDLGYLRLPSVLPTGENEPESNFVRREEIAAPWHVPASLRTVDGDRSAYAHPEGFTVSHSAMEPTAPLLVEFTIAGTSGNNVGYLAIEPDNPRSTGRAAQVPVEPAGGLFDLSQFLPGERPRARARLLPLPGTYRLFWRDASAHQLALGNLVVRTGAGIAEARSLRTRMERAVREGRFHEALLLARTLGLRVTADPRDTEALAALGIYGAALQDRARVLVSAGAWQIGALLAREGRRWAAHDSTTIARASSLAERLADEGRSAARAGRIDEGFLKAREAVLLDPRRSWARRRVEELRAQHLQDYDGGRDQAAYRFATRVVSGGAELDRALIFLGSNERWIEAANLAERMQSTPVDPRARVVLARGLLSRGEATEALALVSGVPCASAHDTALTRGLRGVFGAAAYRPGDTACEASAPRAAPPFEPREASFEADRYVGWTVQGTAFGRGPSHSRATGQQFVNGWRGYYYANSFAMGTDDRTGRLRSRPFAIREEGLSFLVGGGSNRTTVGVRLLIDGTPVLTSAGFDHEGLRRVFWDVRTLRGRTAVIEIFDDASNGPWGHILADDFRVETVIPPDAEAP